jgi:purine nucleosidase
MTSRTIVLDTDIGTDVDDSIALLQLVTGEYHFDSLFVTTSYGDTSMRADIASTYLALAGKSFPVISGSKKTLSQREIFLSGNEGQQISKLDYSNKSTETVQGLMSNLIAAKATVDLVAIGPLTNIAELVLAEPKLMECVNHLYVMGGNFRDFKAEHNFKSDVNAAMIVFNSELPVTVIGIEATESLKIEVSEIPRSTSSFLLNTLASEIDLWCNYRKSDYIVPHDSLAVMLLSHPSLFTLSEPGVITLDESGISTFEPSSQGRHRFVKNFDVSSARELILSTLTQLERIG